MVRAYGQKEEKPQEMRVHYVISRSRVFWGHVWTTGCDVDHAKSPDSGGGGSVEHHKINLYD